MPRGALRAHARSAAASARRERPASAPRDRAGDRTAGRAAIRRAPPRASRLRHATVGWSNAGDRVAWRRRCRASREALARATARSPASPRSRRDASCPRSSNDSADVSIARRSVSSSSAKRRTSAARRAVRRHRAGPGRTSSRTRAIAVRVERAEVRRALRIGWPAATARRGARRSSSGASSRNAYGSALRISCANDDGSGVSRATSRSSPR